MKRLLTLLAALLLPCTAAQAETGASTDRAALASSVVAVTVEAPLGSFDLRDMPGGKAFKTKPATARVPLSMSQPQAAAPRDDLIDGPADTPPSAFSLDTDGSNVAGILPARDAAPIRRCEDSKCTVKVSAEFVVHRAEQLVREGLFDRAQPWLEMLAKTPDYFLQYHFLSGYAAMQQEDFATAESHYRAILERDPSQSRVRLDLAMALLRQNKRSAADYHFKLLQQSDDLPDALKPVVRTARSAIRDQRSWRFSFDVGIAPDTNINNATDAEDVNVRLGPAQLALKLNEDARRKSGIGFTGSFSAGWRTPLGKRTALLVEADGYGVEYEGEAVDDYNLQLATGPEFVIGRKTRLAVQALGSQRWFGGEIYQRNYGGRVDIQHFLKSGQAFALRVDAQRQQNLLNNGYDGWSYGVTASHERGIADNFTLSASLVGRRGELDSRLYSYWSGGGVLGVGGELPYGFNVGLSGSVFTNRYDEPNRLFGAQKRSDMRYGARAVIGNRSFKWHGFSPSIEYSYSRNDSNYAFYESERHRVQLKLARYF